MEGAVRVIRTPGFDRDYWLCRCEGFRVEAPAGWVGTVVELRFGSRLDRPDLLVVRVGRFGRRLLLVSVVGVEEIRPREERLVLGLVPAASGLLPRLRRWLPAGRGG